MTTSSVKDRFSGLTPEQLTVLRERARETAKTPEALEAEELTGILEVRSRNQVFAFPLSGITGVTELVTIAPVPRAHPLVRGVVSFRGEVLIGTEMSAVVWGSSSGIADLRRLVVLTADGLKLALLAEQTLSVRHVRLSSFLGGGTTGQRYRFIVGSDEHFVSLVDPGKLISHVFSQLEGAPS